MTASLYQSGSTISLCDCAMRLTLGVQTLRGKLSMWRIKRDSLASRKACRAQGRRLNREFVAEFDSLGLFLRYQTGSASYAFPFAAAIHQHVSKPVGAIKGFERRTPKALDEVVRTD